MKNFGGKYEETVCFVCLVLLVVCVLSGMTGCGNQDQQVDGKIKVAEQTGQMTLDKYNQIEYGMSYQQVKEIVGVDGIILEEIGNRGHEDYTVIYIWKGRNSKDAKAEFTFTDNKMLARTQVGLE